MRPADPYRIVNEHGQLDAGELRRQAEDAARLAAMDLPGAWWTPHGIALAPAKKPSPPRKDLFYWRHYTGEDPNFPAITYPGLYPWQVAGLVSTSTYFTNPVGSDEDAFVTLLSGMLAVPFITPRGGTLTHMGFIRNKDRVAGFVRLGIYTATSDDDLRPLSLLVDAGVQAVGTDSGSNLRVFELERPAALDPDVLHFAACALDSNAATLPGLHYILPDATILGKTIPSAFNASGYTAGWRSSAAVDPLDAFPAAFPETVEAVENKGSNYFPAIHLLIAP
ncbi:MAG: hypothetical protein IT429_25675 [Gemmataceae bacterium]|nr:hypothetical protein [Gemmataceae bacterium]